MVGGLLPGQDAPIPDVDLLRGAAADGRNQLHLSGHAEALDAGRLGGQSAIGISLRAQSPATNYPFRAAAWSGREPRLLHRDRGCARGAAGSGVVPIATRPGT